MDKRTGTRGLGDELRAMLSDQGKASGNAGPSHVLEATESTHAEAGPSVSFRSARSGQCAVESDYADFAQGYAGSVTPLQQFDGAKHDTNGIESDPSALSKEAGSMSYNTDAHSRRMERAWQPPELRAAADTQPKDYAASVSVSANTKGDADRFFAALQAEECNEAAPTPAPSLPLTNEWTPPSPSHPSSMSREQYEMHVQLARRQAGLSDVQPYRAAERVAPPVDDARLEEGVYARTAEDALDSVWDAQKVRSARAQEYRDATEGTLPTTPYTKVRGQDIVDRLRGWLVREGYTNVRV